MSILIGIGIVTTVTTFYLGRKGWRAFHKAVGITPGVLSYQENKVPLSVSTMRWQQLALDQKHLADLSQQQLYQLQRIDKKVTDFSAYQAALLEQNKSPAITEQQFVLQKLLHTRLPEMLASHYHLSNINGGAPHESHKKKTEARELVQAVLDNIEQRLDRLLDQMQTEHLQALKVMDSYISSHDS